MEEDDIPLTQLQSAYNDGIEAAKAIVRDELRGSTESEYLCASIINAIARKTNPYSYEGNQATEKGDMQR